MPDPKAQSVSWEGYEGCPATVEVYADAARVILLLNGVEVGDARVGRARPYLAAFSLTYAPGELTAVAYGTDGVETGRATLKSASWTLRLVAEPETDHLLADGADLAYVAITLTDDDGILRPLADREVTVEVDGPASLLGFGSGEPVTEEGFSSTRHSTYYGRALAVVRAGHEAGEVSITVTAAGCEPTRVVIPAREPGVDIDVRTEIV